MLRINREQNYGIALRKRKQKGEALLKNGKK